MKVKKIDKTTFDKWVNACIENQRVYGVQAKEDRFVFAPLVNAEDLRLDYDVTILPPKKYFLPPRETLLKFDRKEGFESVFDDQPFVLFGVHPYDMVAISQTDKLFAMDQCDTHYVNRRQKATIVVCDVQNASEEVFAGCKDFFICDGAREWTVVEKDVYKTLGSLIQPDPVREGRIDPAS